MKKFFTFVAVAMAAVAMNAQTPAATYTFGQANSEYAVDENGALSKYTMDGKEGNAVNYTAANNDKKMHVTMATVPGVTFEYGNKDAKEYAIKTGDDFIQLDSKNFVIIVENLKAGDKVAVEYSAKGANAKNPATFSAESQCTATASAVAESKDATKAIYEVTVDEGMSKIKLKEITGGCRIYRLMINAEGQTVTPDPDKKDSVEAVGMNFAGLTAADFQNLVNGKDSTYTMDGVEGPSLNYTTVGELMEFDCRGIHFTYKNTEKTANNIVKTAPQFIQLDGKNFNITVKDVKKGQTVTFYVSAKGSTPAKFLYGEKELGEVAKAADLATYQAVSVVAEKDGDVTIKECKGGFRMTKVEVTDAPIVKLAYSVEVPAKTWECYVIGSFNEWKTFVKMTKEDATHYTAEIIGATDQDEYKYCAGPDWAYVETAADGKDVENRKYAEKDVVAAWKAIPTKSYKYKTIAELCNYVDFHAVEGVSGDLVADTLGGKGFVLENGTALYNSAISSTASTWNVKDDYTAKIALYEKNDTILMGTQFRGASGAKIVLGEFEVGDNAAIEVYWQPNGTSARGLKIENMYDEENAVQDSIEFKDKNVCVVTTLPIAKGFYDKEFVITVVKNTINIAGINIVGLKAEQGVEEFFEMPKAVKVIENGQLVIIKNGVRYTVMGQRL